MRISKIRHKDGKTQVVWQEERDGGLHKHELTSDATPEPEFMKALEALKPHVLELLDFMPGYGDGMRVLGISCTHQKDTDRRGVVVTCTKDLDGTSSPFVINTPISWEPDVDAAGPQLSDEFDAHILDLLGHAGRFVNGHVEQQNLFPAA